MFTTTFTAEDHSAPSSGVLQLQGSANLEFCAVLRIALLDALDKAENLVVDVSQITELDVAALQLFCAARRSAIKRHKNMVLAGNCSAAFFTAVLDAGFNRTHTASCWLEADQACLWGNCGEPTGRKVAS
jgi:anti-anti-sigma regulatory factor